MPALPKQQLIDLLTRQLFRPLRDVNPDSYPEFRRGDVTQIKKEVAGISDHVQGATSEVELLQRFNDAADQAKANGLDTRLADLQLPTVAEAKYHFDLLATQMSVIPS